MTSPDVSILIPSFRTPVLTRLCLRLISKHTPREEIRVFVIDNDSRDASLDYLRSLRWIELIERSPPAGERPAEAHSHALDLAFQRVATPYVLALHTDTLVRRAGWLSYLRNALERRPDIAGVGSWKLEAKPFFRGLAGRAGAWIRRRLVPTTARREGRSETGRARFLRTHCALYRTDLIRRYGLSFSQNGEGPGKALHREMCERGHEMVFLPPKDLMRYVLHLNHATMVLNPDLGARRHTVRAGRSRMRRLMPLVDAERVLADESLDA